MHDGREGREMPAGSGGEGAGNGSGFLHDVAIAGGGPAGLSAGLWLARYLHSVVLVDSGDPRNWETRGVNGYLGLPRIVPAELRGRGRDECRAHGVELIDGCVELAERRGEEEFALTLAGGRVVRARRLLLAIGLKDVWPEIPGLRHLYGRTAHVCPDCDGYDTRGERVVVVAKGRKAVGMALDLATWARQLIVCTNGVPPDLDERLAGKLATLGIPVRTERVERLEPVGENRQVLRLEGGDSIECEHLFFSLAQYPSDDLGVQLGCERDEDGHIVVDHAYHSSVRNVFAAGDIVPGAQLAIAAAADGAIAAIAIHKSLTPPERRIDE
jgi:thioredoxin reductase